MKRPITAEELDAYATYSNGIIAQLMLEWRQVLRRLEVDPGYGRADYEGGGEEVTRELNHMKARVAWAEAKFLLARKQWLDPTRK